VPGAVEIARTLQAPLGLVLVRKIGVPFQQEPAATTIVNVSDPEAIVNNEVVAMAGVTEDYIVEQPPRRLTLQRPRPNCVQVVELLRSVDSNAQAP
jgi:putative phosphoribosyl transferase